ncbi:MAG: C-terminal binding protein [Pirellulaceae bacterium]
MSSPRFKVLITDFIQDDLAPEIAALGDIADVHACSALTEQELLAEPRRGLLEQADAVMAYHFLEIGAEALKLLKRCRLIVRCGVGFDNVDTATAAELGIPVANVPDYGTEEVADSAIGLMLAMLRGITRLDTRLKAELGTWHYREAAPLHRVRGQVCGIIGCGQIGGAFALRAKALGMQVKFYDPYAPDGRDKCLGIERCESLDELLEQSTVVSLHCLLSDETREMINADSLARMPRGSYLVNTARGGVVESSAVLAALESGQLAGAALDVLPHEPPHPEDRLIAAWRDPNSPAYDRLIINPHAAFYSEEGLMDMRTKGSANIRRALTGGRIRNIVNGLEP